MNRINLIGTIGITTKYRVSERNHNGIYIYEYEETDFSFIGESVKLSHQFKNAEVEILNFAKENLISTKKLATDYKNLIPSQSISNKNYLVHIYSSSLNCVYFIYSKEYQNITYIEIKYKKSGNANKNIEDINLQIINSISQN
jgi:hypothetical protein